MYLSHFGLAEAPFSITPDPRYLYMSERHREALAHLLYGVGEGGGFVQLTGEVGTGKTSVCRCLLEQLPQNVDVALILNPRLTAAELLATGCDELRVPYPAGTQSLKVLVDALYHHLLDAHGRGRRTVLIIDEAQDLAPDVLEEVRLLTNLETTRQKLLQVILIGQPELARMLDRPELRQVAQRVTARYHLLPLSLGETRAYVRHRLKVGGRRERIFSEAALRTLHRRSGGVPRVINLISDRALLGAYTQERDGVDTATVRRAAREVFARGAVPRRRVFLRLAAAAGVIALGVGALVVLAPATLGRMAGGVKRDEAPLDGPRETPSRRPGPPSPGGMSPPEAKPAALDGPGVEPVRATVPARTHATITPPSSSAIPGGPGAIALAETLRDPALLAEKRNAFATLYGRWGLEYKDGEAGCDPRRLGGHECVFRMGTWKKLRRLNVPVILELASPTGERRYATVTRLGANEATLDFGGREVAYPLPEIERFWEGSFIALWKPPPGPVPIHPGARGRQVEWVRARLARVDGVGGTPGTTEILRRGPRQAGHGVPAVAGAVPRRADRRLETALQLAAAAREPGIPWLSEPRP